MQLQAKGKKHVIRASKEQVTFRLKPWISIVCISRRMRRISKYFSFLDGYAACKLVVPVGV
jgi:hypothetical protein